MNHTATLIDTIFDLFAVNGQAAYFGESVSELDHALQSAQRAQQSGASEALIVAALLHDIGHLLHGLPENIADQGIDACHEKGGARWLRQYFGPAIVDPVRLHVAAKRYLCATDAGYVATLSPASQQSLHLQGGAFDETGVCEFAQEPHAHDALALRRWDDEAKVPNLVVPGLEHYRALMERCLLSKAIKNDEAI